MWCSTDYFRILPISAMFNLLPLGQVQCGAFITRSISPPPMRAGYRVSFVSWTCDLVMSLLVQYPIQYNFILDGVITALEKRDHYKKHHRGYTCYVWVCKEIRNKTEAFCQNFFVYVNIGLTKMAWKLKRCVKAYKLRIITLKHGASIEA